jgi:hypothetical protein
MLMKIGMLQIRVPPQLAEVLKDYTKEVIRRQPENLVNFSAYYFSNLANIIPEHHDFEIPSVVQISEVFKAVGCTGAVRTCDVRPPTEQAARCCQFDSSA